MRDFFCKKFTGRTSSVLCLLLAIAMVLAATGVVWAEAPVVTGSQDGTIIVAQARTSSWSVFCNKKDRSVVYADTTQIGWNGADFQFWAGPYKTAVEAKKWIDVNCPSGLCDKDYRCVK
jgi:hypothetical protein